MQFKALRVLLVLLVSSIGLINVHAQTTTTYVVTSGRTVNARSCPQLTCGVVTTYAPGTQLEVTEIVSGAEVSGSTQWVRIEDQAGDVYVHSSLVAPVEAAAPPVGAPTVIPTITPSPIPPTITPTPGSSSGGGLMGALRGTGSDNSASEVDMGDWEEVGTRDFAMQIPPDWADMRDILEDPEFLELVAEVLGTDPDELAETMEYALEEGLLDLFLIDFETGANMVVYHIDLGGSPAVLSIIRRALASQAESTGGEVLAQDTIELPNGQSAARVRVHFELRVSGTNVISDQLMFAIIAEDRLYYVTFSIPGDQFEDFEAIFDASFATFEVLD
ncbi:MAG: SH3 domain-containing protein [Anaerolinea sp.]|nr:SH3 domain-containing protein [Anaerolinea sp.]